MLFDGLKDKKCLIHEHVSNKFKLFLLKQCFKSTNTCVNGVKREIM